ncbi:MAG: hypothetical protein HY261_08035 [Chloroflexi bacterium]|nr:hypothetical protein [Chloroflexota bacterium]
MGVNLETINIPGIQPRITAGVQAGTGPDITIMFHNWPHLYRRAIVDVSDVCEWQGKDQEGCETSHAGS